MTECEFDVAFEQYELDDLYAEYIMENCHGDRVIGNGDMLVDAMEDHYLLEDFKEAVLEGEFKA